MDQVPPWQRITEGYESPTEKTAGPIKAVESLKDWKRRNPQQALDILGKNNTKLRQPEVRIVIWPAKDRHTDSQLRTIWKFYYKRCWHLAPYAFHSDLKPYAEFEWVTSPTSFRHLARDASQTIARQPPTATNSVVSTVRHTKLPQDNHRSGPAIAESIKAEPPPNAPRGPRNNTPSQASRFPRIHPDTPKGPSRNLGKAPMRSGEPPLALLLHLFRVYGTPPELVHPSRRSLINNTGPLNAAAWNHSSAQTLGRPGRAYFSPESTRNSSTSSQYKAGQVRLPYSPTPGPSSYSARPYAKPTTNVRSPNRESTKTPGPLDGKKGMGSIELGTPCLQSTYKDLPLTAAQEPVTAQYSRAAGKQPVRSASCSVAVSSPSVSQAQTTNERQACKVCNRKHIGECTPICNNCGRRHQDTCHLCDFCSKWHVGECRYCEKCDSVHYAECHECAKCKTWHVGRCKVCKACEKRHRGACGFSRPSPKRELFNSGSEEHSDRPVTEVCQADNDTTPMPELAVKREEASTQFSQIDVTIPVVPKIEPHTRQGKSDDDMIACNHCHLRHGKDVLKCQCGTCHWDKPEKPARRWCEPCGRCHRPGRCLGRKRTSQPTSSQSKKRIRLCEGTKDDPIHVD